MAPLLFLVTATGKQIFHSEKTCLGGARTIDGISYLATTNSSTSSASSTVQVGDKAHILQVPMTICSCEETIDEFEMLTRDAGRVQQDTLRKILEVNADAEYLKRFSLGRRTDAQTFKSCIPLCLHSDVESYIQRIADGDKSSVLTGKTITSLSFWYNAGKTQVFAIQ